MTRHRLRVHSHRLQAFAGAALIVIGIIVAAAGLVAVADVWLTLAGWPLMCAAIGVTVGGVVMMTLGCKLTEPYVIQISRDE